jgi:hypothetical protein
MSYRHGLVERNSPSAEATSCSPKPIFARLEVGRRLPHYPSLLVVQIATRSALSLCLAKSSINPEVSSPEMAEYFESTERRQSQNPWLRWPLVVSGLIMLLVGIDIANRTSNISRGGSWMMMGFGMAFYELSLLLLGRSQWKWVALFIGLIAWFGGLFGVLRFTL